MRGGWRGPAGLPLPPSPRSPPPPLTSSRPAWAAAAIAGAASPSRGLASAPRGRKAGRQAAGERDRARPGQAAWSRLRPSRPRGSQALPPAPAGSPQSVLRRWRIPGRRALAACLPASLCRGLGRCRLSLAGSLARVRLPPVPVPRASSPDTCQKRAVPLSMGRRRFFHSHLLPLFHPFEVKRFRVEGTRLMSSIFKPPPPALTNTYFFFLIVLS